MKKKDFLTPNRQYLLLPPAAAAHLLAGFNTSERQQRLRTQVDLCTQDTGDWYLNAMYRLGGANHDDAQEFGVLGRQ